MPKFDSSKTYVIVPCFNEEKRLDVIYWNKLAEIANTNWVFVNDGSTDGTKNVLNQINNSTIVDLPRNMGKAEAIRKGISETFKKNSREAFWVGYLDADSAFDVEDITIIINIAFLKDSSYDSYWGSRVALAGRNITRNNLRHILSRILITIFGYRMGNLPYDPQTGFKVFKFNLICLITEVRELIRLLYRTLPANLPHFQIRVTIF